MRGLLDPKMDFVFKNIFGSEKNKAIEIAKSLLDVLDVETISLKTGLSIDEINKLK